MGFCYQKGKGVGQEEAQAIRYYERAANQGFAPSHCQLGIHCRQTNQLEKAVRHFQAAADENFPNGQYNLAVCYLEGIGVAKDLQKARHYFTISGMRSLNQGWSCNSCKPTKQEISQLFSMFE